jgi:hypothetical protein
MFIIGQPPPQIPDKLLLFFCPFCEEKFTSFEPITFKKEKAALADQGWPSLCRLVLFLFLHCFSALRLAVLQNSYYPCNVRKTPDPEIEGSCLIDGDF